MRYIAQKDSFLCAPRGTSVDIAFTRRIGAGFFGGEGLIRTRISGDGVAVLHASGAIWERRRAQEGGPLGGLMIRGLLGGVLSNNDWPCRLAISSTGHGASVAPRAPTSAW